MMWLQNGWHHRLWLLLGSVMLSGVMTSGLLASHPFHVSSAEVNWNSKTGNFEVALCVWPADLEKAIARQQAKSVDLDEVGNADELMQQYIASRFQILRSSDGAAKEGSTPAEPQTATPAFRWVGHEMDLKKAWLYFEIPGDEQPDQWQIENRVFFELNEDQMNQVQVTGNGRILAADSLSVENRRIEFETVRELHRDVRLGIR